MVRETDVGGHRENCPLHRAGHDDKAFGGNGGNTGGGSLSGGAGTTAAAEKLADPRAVRRICSDLFPAGAVVSGAESGAVRRTADLCAGNAGKLCAVSGGTVVSLTDPGLFTASGGKRFRTVGTANRRQLQRV